MKRQLTIGDYIFDSFIFLIMVIIVVATLYPFLYVLFASFSDALSLAQHRGLLFRPLGFSTAAYRIALNNPMILRAYMNTLTIVVVGTILNIFFTSMSGYVLSRKRFAARNVIMLMATFTMFFGGGLIPFYLQVRALHLHNTYFALWLPTLISTFNLIILRTAYAAVPDSLEESAKIDGANDMVIYLRIMTPLILPTIAVIVLFSSVGHWNGWFNAMLFLSNREAFPLQLILREILVHNTMVDMLVGIPGTDQEMVGETIKYATIVIATLPILFVYPFLQKYFIHGMMIGAVKE